MFLCWETGPQGLILSLLPALCTTWNLPLLFLDLTLGTRVTSWLRLLGLAERLCLNFSICEDRQLSTRGRRP